LNKNDIELGQPTSMPKKCRPWPPGLVRISPGLVNRKRSAQIRHRWWLSEMGVIQFILKRRTKKKDEIEKDGLKKRTREKIDTKVGQSIWMLKRSIICFINLFINLNSNLISNFQNY